MPFFFIIKEIQDKNRFKKKIMMFNVVEKKIELKVFGAYPFRFDNSSHVLPALLVLKIVLLVPAAIPLFSSKKAISLNVILPDG